MRAGLQQQCLLFSNVNLITSGPVDQSIGYMVLSRAPSRLPGMHAGMPECRNAGMVKQESASRICLTLAIACDSLPLKSRTQDRPTL